MFAGRRLEALGQADGSIHSSVTVAPGWTAVPVPLCFRQLPTEGPDSAASGSK